MSIALDHLLSQIPFDTEKRVQRTRDLLNKPIRELLRRETGLRLDRGDQEESFVFIRLAPGWPTALKKREIDKQYEKAILLAPLTPALKRLKEGADTVSEFLGKLPAGSGVEDVLKKADVCLPPAAQLAEGLLREIQKFDLLKWIFQDDEQVAAVSDDILGHYTYAYNRRTGASGKGSILLYWAVIGLVALLLDESVEDLAAVVLAHELAHAYTHLGYDIDGENWQGEVFAKADRELKEGLAQYYTKLVCERLRQMPHCIETYEALLEEQSPAYKTHLPWTKEFTAEEVRLGMIETRRQNRGDLKFFQKALNLGRHRFRGGAEIGGAHE